MAMLADIICLIQGYLKSIDNRLANLEEALATPQTSMVDMMILELDSDGLDFVAYQPDGAYPSGPETARRRSAEGVAPSCPHP